MIVSVLRRSRVPRRSLFIVDKLHVCDSIIPPLASGISSADGSFNDDEIPEPTWSIKDLQLSSCKDPVSMEELERLALKSLLDLSKLQDPDALRNDLSNMLHCLEQVRHVSLPELTDEEVYDVPRGVTAAPLRNSRDDVWEKKDQEEAKQVWESLLHKKTIQRGAHSYFSVVTKRDDVPE